MKKITFLESLQVNNNIDRIKEILDSNILQTAASKDRSSLCESALIEYLIRLNDLLQKCKKLDMWLNFKDDILNDDNITNLISNLRNSACHITSNWRLLNNEIPFCFSIIGPLRTAKYWSWISNEYEDDIIFCYGNNYAYLNRHLVRAYNESKDKLNNIEIEPPLDSYKWGSFWCAWI